MSTVKYGEEWRKEVMKNHKSFIVDMLREALILKAARNELGDGAIAQIVRLSDWLNDNEPNTFWDEDGDAATVIIGLLEKYRARIRDLENAEVKK